MVLNCLAVGIGGFIGAVCRYLAGLLPVKETTLFPAKTLAVNLLGCIFIGLIAGLAVRHLPLHPRLMLFLQTGICGGFTTFSTFALETDRLIYSGHMGLAALYVLLSVAAGVGLAAGVQLLLGR